MDRRQRKSRAAIFTAFSHLLEKKRYEKITVGEIIEEADVCRSTFYSHFETKDMLLKEICGEIFDHILNDKPCKYKSDQNTLQSKLTHILLHLREEKSDTVAILKTQSADIFMEYLKGYLSELFSDFSFMFKMNVPKTYLINHLTTSFCETLKWWVKTDMEDSAETIARYFLSVTETH